MTNNTNLGLTSAGFFTVAKVMREQNKEPDELMSYSEHSGAVATYAVINAFESIASGLWTEEQRQLEAAKARFLESMERARTGSALLSDDG
jgi:hypothetical protein